MTNKKTNKILTTLDDLKDLSQIPEGNKKRVMERNVAGLSTYMVLYRQA
ncbi:MAG: hypothetical protein MJ233_00140 [Mycoplasmoidaceae bacterium]|nr:hypothetical protein [Mycoplasmoidaceae bacterium]